MGDKQGHEFHGNQWTDAKSGGGTQVATSSRGDWNEDPLAGEAPGHHTPAAQKRVIDYLERATGEKFVPHGSVGRGETSLHDFDIAIRPTSDQDQEQAWLDSMKAEAEVFAREQRGEITHDQAMEEVYGGGSPVDKIGAALNKIGFVMTREMLFSGNYVARYARPGTGHTIEVWAEGDAGNAESGPRSWSRDFDPKTGKVIKEERG